MTLLHELRTHDFPGSSSSSEYVRIKFGAHPPQDASKVATTNTTKGAQDNKPSNKIDEHTRWANDKQNTTQQPTPPRIHRDSRRNGRRVQTVNRIVILNIIVIWWYLIVWSQQLFYRITGIYAEPPASSGPPPPQWYGCQRAGLRLAPPPQWYGPDLSGPAGRRAIAPLT